MSGHFEGLQTMEFVMTYHRPSDHPRNLRLEYLQWANLVVEDIPIKSIQSPSKGL